MMFDRYLKTRFWKTTQAFKGITINVCVLIHICLDCKQSTRQWFRMLTNSHYAEGFRKCFGIMHLTRYWFMKKVYCWWFSHPNTTRHSVEKQSKIRKVTLNKWTSFFTLLRHPKKEVIWLLVNFRSKTANLKL